MPPKKQKALRCASALIVALFFLFVLAEAYHSHSGAVPCVTRGLPGHDQAVHDHGCAGLYDDTSRLWTMPAGQVEAFCPLCLLKYSGKDLPHNAPWDAAVLSDGSKLTTSRDSSRPFKSVNPIHPARAPPLF